MKTGRLEVKAVELVVALVVRRAVRQQFFKKRQTSSESVREGMAERLYNQNGKFLAFCGHCG